jgi:integrase
LPDLTASELPKGNRPVASACDLVIEETCLRLPTNLAAMVRAHRLIGCRAQEIVVARTCDFDLQADHDAVPEAESCWLYRPTESKTGESYWIGPRAQAVLSPLLRPDSPQAWLFPTRKRGRGCWTTASYRRAIDRACKQEPPLPHWSPLQLRHAAGEEARQKHPKGLEATQARLRHKEMQVSQKYAHDLSALGRDVARQLG